ncbi:MAG: HlyD family type I secretion periplasmic adaptor subunit [Acetobacteraceae bacterium]
MSLPRLFHSTPPIEARGGAARDGGALDAAVLEFQSPSNIILEALPKRSARNTIWIVAWLVVTMLVVAGFVPMSMEVTAHGQVISRAPTIHLEPLSTAIVRSIDVHVGQIVHTGQLLATLDPTEAEADLKTLLAKQSALAAQVAEQRAEFEAKPYKPADLSNRDQMLQSAIYAERMSELKYTLSNYDQQVRSLSAKVQGAQAEAAYYRDQLALAREIEGMNRMLKKLNAGSRLTVLQSEQQRIQTASNVAQSVEAAESAEQTLKATQAQRQAFLQQWKAKLSSGLATNATELASVEQSIAKAKLVSKLVTLRAPQDAVVLHVQRGVSPGSVMQSGQQFIALSPLHAPLEIESYVKGSDQGFVQPGQRVTIKFATFPFVLFGSAKGTVRLVTSNSFTPQQMAEQLTAIQTTPQTAPRDVPTTELYYGARIAIDSLHLRGVPPDFHVRPGMPVETDIRVGSQTLLQYLLERVAPVFYQGMREPS